MQLMYKAKSLFENYIYRNTLYKQGHQQQRIEVISNNKNTILDAIKITSRFEIQYYLLTFEDLFCLFLIYSNIFINIYKGRGALQFTHLL